MTLLDEFSFRARLQPALLALLPAAVAIALIAPAAYRGLASVAATAAAFGATLFLSSLARRLGRQVERRLWKAWGGKPTALMLRHADLQMDRLTKARRHRELERHIPDWRAPSSEEEAADPVAAMSVYESAVTWLLSQTRDRRRFALLYRENIAYGFWRNLRGLRTIGLAIAAAAAVASLIGLLAPGGDTWAASVSFVIAALAGLSWLTVVTDAAVRDAADGYGRALLDCCDNLPESTEPQETDPDRQNRTRQSVAE